MKSERAQGLPKINKDFVHVPPLCAIIDTTGSFLLCDEKKNLSSLLAPVARNEYTSQKSFDAANHI